MEVGLTFKLENYLSQESMNQLAKECFESAVREKFTGNAGDVERVITNSAYDIAAKVVEEKHHIDLDRVLTEKVAVLLMDDAHLKYIVFRDDREYGGRHVGIGLEMLEGIIRTKFHAKFEEIAEKIVSSIDFKSKKFEKMVTQEVAKIVASRIAR